MNFHQHKHTGCKWCLSSCICANFNSDNLLGNNSGYKIFYSCNMGMSDLPEMYAQRQAYISGKSRVPMLQLICNTSVKVKADNLNANTSGITRFVIYACLKDLIMVRQQVTL